MAVLRDRYGSTAWRQLENGLEQKSLNQESKYKVIKLLLKEKDVLF